MIFRGTRVLMINHNHMPIWQPQDFSQKGARFLGKKNFFRKGTKYKEGGSKLKKRGTQLKKRETKLKKKSYNSGNENIKGKESLIEQKGNRKR